MTGIRIIAAILVILPVLACAPVSRLPQVDDEAAKLEAEKQRQLVVERTIRDRSRLHHIAYRILKANAELCGEKVRKSSGLQIVNKFSFGKEYEKAAEVVLGVGKKSKIIAVARGSAADDAGFLDGDILLSLGDWDVPENKEGIKEAAKKFMAGAENGDALALRVIRDGDENTFTFQPESVCAYRYSLENKDIVNAFADGNRIVISTGMLRFAENDTELATVIGHEIAHNMMDHNPKTQTNAAIGMVFDILLAGIGVSTGGAFQNLAARAFSEGFEAEADYVGLYLMARAGFAIENTPNFWRRMGMNSPGSIREQLMASHPATPRRFLALEKTVAEIKAKRAADEPLIPEREKESTQKVPEPESADN